MIARYIDSGHGHALGLSEIELRNADGNFVDTKTGSIEDAASQAVAQNLLPTRSTDSFASVKLLNLPGQNTWPIVAMTYLYVDQDLTSLGDLGRLLEVLLKIIVSDDGRELAQEFDFVPVPAAVQALNEQALSELVFANDTEAWVIETSTIVGGGAGDNVLSTKRQTYGFPIVMVVLTSLC